MRDISGFRSRNMFKRRHQQIWLLCSMFVLALLLCCGMAFAAEETPKLETWIDHAADGFAGGTGTENDPYLITTAEQLAYLAKMVNSGETYAGIHFRLLQDIDLAGHNWLPIGSLGQGFVPTPGLARTPYFSGMFDGGAHKISHISIPDFCIDAGLFGVVQDGEITSVTVDGCDIRKAYFGGGIAARTSKAKISHCTVEGLVAGNRNIGGIVGTTFSTKIFDCSAQVQLQGRGLYIKSPYLESFYQKYDELFPIDIFGSEQNIYNNRHYSQASTVPFPMPTYGALVGYASKGLTVIEDCRAQAGIYVPINFYYALPVVGQKEKNAKIRIRRCEIKEAALGK